MDNYNIVHVVDKCKGCAKCVRACLKAHDGVSNCRIFKVGDKFAYFSCLHCRKPQCAEVCPVGALQRVGSAVVFYKERCIGCKNCIEACPWGVPRYNAKLGIKSKCDACYVRVIGGGQPYCVEACPEGALVVKEVKVPPKKPAAKAGAKPAAKGGEAQQQQTAQEAGK